MIERIAANVEEGRGGDANEMWEMRSSPWQCG